MRPSGLRVTPFSTLAALARMGEANLRPYLVAVHHRVVSRIDPG